MLSPEEIELQTLVQEILKRDPQNGERDLADELRISRPAIQLWVAGKNLPYRKVVPLVIRYLKERTKVRVKLEDESVCVRRDASISVYDGDKLVAMVIAKIEKKQGADGDWYDCVVLKKSGTDPLVPSNPT